MRDFEFDPAKDEANRAKHGIALSRAADFDWGTAVIRPDLRSSYGESRFIAIGRLGEGCMFWSIRRARIEFGSSGLERQTRERCEFMVKRKKPAHISQKDWNDADIPELTAEDFRRMRPAREVLREQFGEKIAARLLRPRGRPPKADPKAQVTLRLDAEVLQHFKAGGPGWQTRINAVLKRAASKAR